MSQDDQDNQNRDEQQSRADLPEQEPLQAGVSIPDVTPAADDLDDIDDDDDRDDDARGPGLPNRRFSIG